MGSTSIEHEEFCSEGTPGEGEKGNLAVPKSPFITTSDIINRLNSQLSELSTFANETDLASSQQQQPRFELQKRLPDGSAIPATQDETDAANFKTKLDQSAKFVSQLESPADRQYWAEQQRLIGNGFFQQGDYKAAMDIYLTCLVVKENTSGFLRDTLLPVLNNLAQCTLQLGMYAKTILFCEMALEEVSKAKQQGWVEGIDAKEKQQNEQEVPAGEKSTTARRDLEDAIVLCKIYFKRGKALRLKGHYKEAREAINCSLDCLAGKDGKPSASSFSATDGDAIGNVDSSISLTPYRKAIKKEFRFLDIAEKEGKRNRDREKRAMQTVLSLSPTTSLELDPSTSQGKSRKRSAPQPLYQKSSEPRQFSRLRARKSPSTFKQQDDPNVLVGDDSPMAYYSRYYWSMVARVAKALLVMLGDGDDANGMETSNSATKQANTRKKGM
ncbi:unnamed protein product [Pseudo-nitzschia multistriata]|uniref:Uncharacterized protein n=1 Tax=Pseudo-nitzschia multistriata TaxID=183589 RepID=A0A448ZHU5_9STRA|nr:unnamed protein product [Pseudo-nitzschia multistriata]